MIRGYNLYGLKVNSELEIAFQNDKKPYKNPDATIMLGKAKKPSENLKRTYYRPFTIFNNELYYQEVPTIAKYLINKKGDVTVEPYPNQNTGTVSLFFIDSILPMLLLKKNIFPIRASAIKTPKGIFLIAAPRGVGKSVLATYFCLGGYQFIGDNLITLKWNNKTNSYQAKCFDQYVTLWKDVLPIFGEKRKDYTFTPIRENLKKYKTDFSKHAYKLFDEVKAIIILKHINADVPLKYEEIKGFEKVNVSKKMVQSNDIARVISKHEALFKFCGQLSEKLKFYQVDRSSLLYPKAVSKFINDEIFSKTTH